jgi:hypothetical protein
MHCMLRGRADCNSERKYWRTYFVAM